MDGWISTIKFTNFVTSSNVNDEGKENFEGVTF